MISMITTKVKKWGNSFGLIIPKDEMRKLNINENQEVVVDITKKENPLKELFGSGKKHKINKSTEQILKEVRKDLGIG